MSLKQDYILRLIEQVIDLITENAFGVKTKEEISENFSNTNNSTEKYNRLIYLIDEGKINEAENQLFDYLDENTLDDLKIALLFYDYLNKKDDEFLKENDFSREEIKDGLLDISKKYGYDNFVQIYLMEN